MALQSRILQPFVVLDSFEEKTGIAPILEKLRVSEYRRGLNLLRSVGQVIRKMGLEVGI